MDVSVVIACEGALPADGQSPPWLLAARMAAQQACATAGMAGRVALILAGEAAHGVTGEVLDLGGGVTERRVVVAAGSLVPVRWTAGLNASTGDAVCFLIDRCSVPPGWVCAAIEGLRAGHVGVGGGFRLAADHTRLDAAVYHLRYGAFPPAGPTLDVTHGELAGDNAAYAMDAVQAQRDEWAEGFWEVTLHRIWRAEGRTLARSSAMDVAFSGSVGVLAFAAQRFRHGQHAGHWRITVGQTSRARILLSFAAVPAVLLSRAWRRAGRMDKRYAGLLGAAPEFLLLAASWAAGEAVAAVRYEGND